MFVPLDVAIGKTGHGATGFTIQRNILLIARMQI